MGCLLLGCAQVEAAVLPELRIASETGQALLARLDVHIRHQNTDIACFNLFQHPNTPASHLDYTTLGPGHGELLLWSEAPLEQAVAYTLTDQCAEKRWSFQIQPDLTYSAIQEDSTRVATASPPAAATAAAAEAPPPPAAVETNTIPLEAYDKLQSQINALQRDFANLHAKSDALYASHLTQTQIMAKLKLELVALQRENQLLRTLVSVLGLALLASGFFFAAWLRRHAALPTLRKGKTANNRHSQGPVTHPPGSRFAHTQPPVQSSATTTPLSAPTLPAGRLKPVPAQANDDAVSMQPTAGKLSSQQSTQAAMQDASRLLTHGRVNQAIEHLQQHLAKHPKSSLWMWLYLLDLLSKEGKSQAFAMMAAECRKHFNINVEPPQDSRPHGLEAFPRVLKALQQAWGTPQVIALIDDLVYNTRLVPRMGFERSVFEDLMLLKDIACQTQNLPAVPPSAKPTHQDAPVVDSLRELQQLSDDIQIMAPVDQTPFAYWTDFTFELPDSPALLKTA